MVHFWLCLEDGYENFEQLGLKFSKLSLPPATIKSSKQSQWIQSYVVFSKQTSFVFLSFHWFEDIFQYSKVGQNGVTEPLYCSLTWSKHFLGNPQIKAKQFSFFLYVVWFTFSCTCEFWHNYFSFLTCSEIWGSWWQISSDNLYLVCLSIMSFST